jgi:hypothetical protein
MANSTLYVGLMNPDPDLGLNPGSGLQQRESDAGVGTSVPSTRTSLFLYNENPHVNKFWILVTTSRRITTRSGSNNAVMDVDMESDAEREREVERLPWTLGVSHTSSSQDAPRLNLSSESILHRLL